MADIEAPLSYGRLTGDFWAVLEDTADLGDAPDTSPLAGVVTFTPSYRVLRVSSESVDRRGVVYVESVTARVVNGVLVDDFGEPGVSLLAADSLNGLVTPNDIFWTASFNLTMASGESLVTQPEPTMLRLAPGETRSISDFVPPSIDGGGEVRVVTVDRETLRLVDNQVEYINKMVEELGIVIEEGVVKGDPGEKGDPGDQGPIGPYGPPGRAGSVEVTNYVTNPTPASNDGFNATNGTVTYSNNTLTLTPTDASRDSYVSWVKAVPTFPGTNMYLRFDAVPSNSNVNIQSTITFLNGELAPVDFDTIVHSGDNDLEAPEKVESADVGTFSHMTYTDGPASFAIFSLGIPGGSPAGTTLVLNKFFFSDTPGYYFSGSDTIDGYSVRWMGPVNDSYSVLTPTSTFTSHAVSSVNGERGDITIDAATLGLGQVNNTSDEDKPISADTQEALDNKVDSASLIPTVAANYRVPQESMYFKEFSRFATQEVWTSTDTFVDISYIVAPIAGYSSIRLSIPGSTTGNSASSIPTVEGSIDGATWSTWRTLTSAPPSGVTYTSIDGDFIHATGELKVLARQETTGDSVVLHLYTITQDGNVTSKVLGTFSAASDPYSRPSVVSTPQNDGSLYLYYTDSAGAILRKTVSAVGTLGTTITNLNGLKSNAYAKVSRFYGSYVAASPDGSAVGSPGILISSDGVSWRGKGVTSSHTWARGASAITMSAYPGVSGGKVGVFIDYVNGPKYNLHRIFITSRPIVTGTLTGVATDPGVASTAGSTISFPGTLPTAPTVIASSNDSKLNLGVVAVSGDGGTIERFNMGASPSPNATIKWTAIS